MRDPNHEEDREFFRRVLTPGPRDQSEVPAEPRRLAPLTASR